MNLVAEEKGIIGGFLCLLPTLVDEGLRSHHFP